MAYIVLGYFVSLVVGYVIVGLCLYGMRKTALRGPFKIREFFKWLDLWVGCAERFVATTLLAFAPAYLAAFIGGWVGLKFAAGWHREKSSKGTITQTRLLALVGSILSFVIAIAAGLIIKPDALTYFAK